MPHRKISRIQQDIDFKKSVIKTKSFNFRKTNYDWEKLLRPEVLKRNIWIVKIWGELHKKNPQDEFIRNLSTDDMYKTKWFEKYGYKEPDFKN